MRPEAQELPADERRAWPRYEVDAVQEIARYDEGEIPPRDAFEKVRCVDISRGGFAFYRTAEPDFEQLVVALGDAPDFTYVAARIVNSAKTQRWGQIFYRVGCQFVGRIRPGEKAASDAQDDGEVDSAVALLTGGNTNVTSQS